MGGLLGEKKNGTLAFTGVLFFCFCLLELMFVFGRVCVSGPKEWCILNSVDYVVGIVACQVVGSVGLVA